MAIRSHAFGRVTLTEGDAAKFRNQAKFGKPKQAAVQTVQRGVEMEKKFRDNGAKITLTLKRG